MSHATGTAEREGFELLLLRSPSLEAAYAPGAGMVCCSLRSGGEELLGQRDGLAAYARRAKTMGIPLLHPWANRLAGLEYEALGRSARLDPAAMPVKLEEHGLPIHGLLAGDPRWRVTRHDAASDGAWLTASFDYTADPVLLAAFPFPHRLEIEAVLRGNELTVATTLQAEPGGDVPVAFGYHPYFALPGVPRAEWVLELPEMRHMELGARGLPTWATEPFPARTEALGATHYDHAFEVAAEPARFAVAGGGRRIAVELAHGYPYAQLFAPPGYDVVCFEPMTAPANPFGPPPAHAVARTGTAFTATFRIAVEGG